MEAPSPVDGRKLFRFLPVKPPRHSLILSEIISTRSRVIPFPSISRTIHFFYFFEKISDFYALWIRRNSILYKYSIMRSAIVTAWQIKAFLMATFLKIPGRLFKVSEFNSAKFPLRQRPDQWKGPNWIWKVNDPFCWKQTQWWHVSGSKPPSNDGPFRDRYQKFVFYIYTFKRQLSNRIVIVEGRVKTFSQHTLSEFLYPTEWVEVRTTQTNSWQHQEERALLRWVSFQKLKTFLSNFFVFRKFEFK